MLGGPALKRHIVEFVPGLGMVMDGVVDTSQGTSGPFTWTPPVPWVYVSGVASGGGGSGGFGSTAQRAGGGGGGSGMWTLECPLLCTPGSPLTVTLGAAGAGGAVGAAGTGRFNTTITGLSVRSPNATLTSGTPGTFTLKGGAPAGAATGSTAGGGGRAGDDFTNRMGDGGTGGTNAASPPTGTVGTLNQCLQFGPIFCGFGGSGGGAASTVATTAGNFGGLQVGTSAPWIYTAPPAGTQDGTVSYGGGGQGGMTPWGRPGNAGGGNAAASAPPSNHFGVGGSGGGGNGAGAAGGPAYICLEYWSAE
jgi:hypothetical protein